jgi:predicted transcriptional regulator
MRKANQNSKPLTAAELEMMNVIWRIGACTVAQVREQLQPARVLAYTSVSTIIRILEQKGFVTSEREGRGHVYTAAVSKDNYQARSLKHLLNHVFESAPSLLVRHLLDSRALTDGEIAEIKALLRKRER